MIENKKKWKLIVDKNRILKWWSQESGNEIDNFSFKATLKLYGYGRGRSSAVLYYNIEYLEEVPIINTSVIGFLNDSIDIINNMDHGKITGLFTFCKRGQNYGIQLIKLE